MNSQLIKLIKQRGRNPWILGLGDNFRGWFNVGDARFDVRSLKLEIAIKSEVFEHHRPRAELRRR